MIQKMETVNKKKQIKIKKFTFLFMFIISGIHWFVIFLISENNVPEFFDSFGREPKRSEILYALKNFERVKYNKKQLQSCFSSVCGIYCCLYIFFRCYNITFESFLSRFNDKLLENDLKSIKMFKDIFSQTSTFMQNRYKYQKDNESDTFT